MKMKYFLVTSLVLLFNKCGDVLPNYYDVKYINNADFDIYYCVADNYRTYSEPVYPDTTIVFDKIWLGLIKTRLYFIRTYCEKTVEKIIDEIPSDTLSIYYFHPDTLATYSWSEIQQGYKILQRYDLSIEDIHLLYNKYGVPEISYPPDERMKNMRMYPSYGTYNK